MGEKSKNFTGDDIDAKGLLKGVTVSRCACVLYKGGGSFCKLTGQLADKPTRGQSSRGLDNSRTGQLADSEY